MREQTENIYPMSPLFEGGKFVLKHGYKGVVVTDSTREVAFNSATDYFTNLTPDEHRKFGTHPELVKRPDFIKGVVHIAKIKADFNEREKYIENFDRGIYPHIEALKLERQVFE